MVGYSETITLLSPQNNICELYSPAQAGSSFCTVATPAALWFQAVAIAQFSRCL